MASWSSFFQEFRQIYADCRETVMQAAPILINLEYKYEEHILTIVDKEAN
jgi:hypothetical protein